MLLLKLTGETQDWGTLRIKEFIISLFMLLSFCPIIIIGICGIDFVPVVFDLISVLFFWFYYLFCWGAIIGNIIYLYISYKLKQ